ncbi:MAG TPA: ATP-binding protein [Bacteroidota bacterium]|nr:ATP-binding protein [Bacteroidota bacterium]
MKEKHVKGDGTLPASAGAGTHPACNERNEQRLRSLDLHDETGQILTALLINLRHLGRLSAGAQLQDTIRDTQNLVEMLFHSIRSYLNGPASPPGRASAPDPEILPALRRLTGDFSRRTGIEVTLEAGCDPERMTKEHKAVIYRVVQESLTNVFKHSAASRVAIRCARTGEKIRLEIEDDGLTPQGLTPHGVVRTGAARTGGRWGGRNGTGDGTGNGIRGMRERIRLIGGDFTARLLTGRGMSIVVELPYNIS